MSRLSQNASLLQTVDRVAGIPLCFALTLVRRLAGLFAAAPTDAPPRSILLLKLAEQGSTVLAHDAIRRAIAQVGREHVCFLVFEENRFIVDVLALVPRENVFTIDTRSAWRMAVSCLQRLAEIRRRRIEACIDMEFFARFTAAIAFFTGARIRVGFHGPIGEAPYRGDLHTHRVPYNPHLHTSPTFTALVMALGGQGTHYPAFPVVPPPGTMPPRFHAAPDEVAQVRATLVSAGMDPGRPMILLNANASDLLPLRRWSEANYVTLARRLLAEFPALQIGFTGAPGEAPRIVQLCREVDSPRALCLAGRTTLRQLLIVYDFADVLVTNDSGPAHFAALTGIDCVALFGPETPLLYAGNGPRQHPLWARLACSPCVNAFNNRRTSCRDNQCMQALTVEVVFAKVRAVFLARQAAAS
ncbi:MAG: glycosyltransferase family 9 protein [Verrucomicrobia bacterium]|nr:glycosyltransferase family 9 protein [Verrucomicrobiota bacterium]